MTSFCRSAVFTVNFKHISQIFLFPLLTLNQQTLAEDAWEAKYKTLPQKFIDH